MAEKKTYIACLADNDAGVVLQMTTSEATGFTIASEYVYDMTDGRVELTVYTVNNWIKRQTDRLRKKIEDANHGTYL